MSPCVHCLESQTAALADYLSFSFPQSSPQPSAILGPFQMNHSLVESWIVIIKRGVPVRVNNDGWKCYDQIVVHRSFSQIAAEARQ